MLVTSAFPFFFPFLDLQIIPNHFLPLNFLYFLPISDPFIVQPLTRRPNKPFPPDLRHPLFREEFLFSPLFFFFFLLFRIYFRYPVQRASSG